MTYKYRRGKIELYSDIVKACPEIVSKLMRIANINYTNLVLASEVRLVILPSLGKGGGEQIVTLTEKGKAFKRAVIEIERILRIE